MLPAEEARTPGHSLQCQIDRLIAQHGTVEVLAAISYNLRDRGPTVEATDHPVHWARFHVDHARVALDPQGGRN